MDTPDHCIYKCRQLMELGTSLGCLCANLASSAHGMRLNIARQVVLIRESIEQKFGISYASVSGFFVLANAFLALLVKLPVSKLENPFLQEFEANRTVRP